CWPIQGQVSRTTSRGALALGPAPLEGQALEVQPDGADLRPQSLGLGGGEVVAVHGRELELQRLELVGDALRDRASRHSGPIPVLAVLALTRRSGRPARL